MSLLLSTSSSLNSCLPPIFTQAAPRCYSFSQTIALEGAKGGEEGKREGGRMPSCEEDEEIIRAIPLDRILKIRNFGLFLSSEGKESDFALSEPASRIEYFISHSWSAWGGSKLISLFSFLCWKKAVFFVFLSHFVLVLGFLGWFRLSPSHVQSLELRDFNFAFVLTGFLSFCLAHLIGPFVPTFSCKRLFSRLRRKSKAESGADLETQSAFKRSKIFCFLDKCCIHQTDPAKKKKGIQNIDIFLKKAEKILVLWSVDYFTRLWCVYELAVFLRFHRQSQCRAEQEGELQDPVLYAPHLLFDESLLPPPRASSEFENKKDRRSSYPMLRRELWKLDSQDKARERAESESGRSCYSLPHLEEKNRRVYQREETASHSIPDERRVSQPIIPIPPPRETTPYRKVSPSWKDVKRRFFRRNPGINLSRGTSGESAVESGRLGGGEGRDVEELRPSLCTKCFSACSSGSESPIVLLPLTTYLFTSVFLSSVLVTESVKYLSFLLELDFVLLTATCCVDFLVSCGCVLYFTVKTVKEQDTLASSLTSFSLDKAKCSLEEDRALILNTIQELYDCSIQDFESHVKRKFAGPVRRALGVRRDVLPLRFVFVLSLPRQWGLLSSFFFEAIHGGEWRLRGVLWVVRYVTAFLHTGISIAFGFFMVRVFFVMWPRFSDWVYSEKLKRKLFRVLFKAFSLFLTGVAFLLVGLVVITGMRGEELRASAFFSKPVCSKGSRDCPEMASDPLLEVWDLIIGAVSGLIFSWIYFGHVCGLPSCCPRVI